MRLLGIFGMLGNFIYFVGMVLGLVFFAMILTVFLPAWVAWAFAALVVIGIVLGVVQIRETSKIQKQMEDKK